MKLVTALFKAGYADLNYASLGVSAIIRKRNWEVKTDVKFRDTFCIFQKTLITPSWCTLVLHFDGKII